MAAPVSKNASNPRYGGWYNEPIQEAPEDFRKLLETYSEVPGDEVVPLINQIRAKAFDHDPYPCIGQFKFTQLTLRTHPEYDNIKKRLSESGVRFLDLACCFGQDLRQLVADGVPARACIGIDIEQTLIDIGYELFRDRNTLKSAFYAADVYDVNDPTWKRIEDSVDIIHVSAFFHLFPWAKQVEAAAQLVRISKSQPGSAIVGRQMGSLTPAEFPAMEEGMTGFRHDPRTLQQLWDEVGVKTNTRWKVDAALDSHGVMGTTSETKEAKEKKDRPAWAEPNMRRLLFTITRE